MIKFSVTGNLRDTMRAIEEEKGAIRKAAARAINRLATQGRTQFSREVRKEYNVRATEVAKAIAISQRASPNALEAVITSKGRPVSLARFGARQTRKGVSLRIRKAAGRESIRGAFIVSKAGGNVVFARGRYVAGKFVYDPRPGRLPIQKLFGPAVPSMFGNESVQRAVGQFIAANFQTRFAHELRFLRAQRGQRS